MIEAFGASDPGCVRPNNEDSFLVAPESGLYIVADGMGGAQAGEYASRMAVDVMREAVQACCNGACGPMNAVALEEAVQQTNDKVHQAATGNPDRQGMGTTLVAAVEHNGELLIASVGDSRAYRFLNGRLEPITEDQSWVNEVGRKIGLDDEALRTHRMRNVLTMAIGVSKQLRVNSYRVALEPGAEFLLSSDGLHGVLTDAEIEHILSSGGSLEARSRALIAATRDKGAPDNVTVVLLRST